MIIGMCGSGTMGRGIAIAAVSAEHDVVMYDISDDVLTSAQQYISSQLDKAVEKKKMTSSAAEQARSRLSYTSTLTDLAKAEIVIEAIIERIDIKHALYEQIEAAIGPKAIIASNTSSISIAALARPLRRKERFIGLHFFNPANIMKLVEVVRGPETNEHTVKVCTTFAKELGKVPVVARDAPGFIVNRIARNYYNEAQRLVMEGAASVETIDALMQGLGFKLGPFELMDLIGVDTNLDVTKSQWEQFFLEPRFTPSLLQQQVVDAGKQGKKSGRGFYDYDE